VGISLGLVGLGAFGSSFAELFKNHPAVDRVALCDRVPERMKTFAERESFQDKFDPSDAYDSLDALLKSDVDAVVIITQHWLHTPQAVQALEAGKHVYSAVPLLSVPDGDEILEWCDRLVKTVERTGLHYMYGETTYYRPQAMFCRRKAAEGAFGHFVYAEGEYFHDVDHGLREVKARREGSVAGREYQAKKEGYKARGVVSGPMHYPTHSTAGPICVMNAHAVKVACWGQRPRVHADYYTEEALANETALFQMSNGATCRISEYREIGFPGREIFRVYGTEGSFEHDKWCDKNGRSDVGVDAMRDPLPDEVVRAFAGRGDVGADLSEQERKDFLGGHGGSHAYLVHEFCDAVAHDRTAAITAWDAVRYTAAGVAAHKSALKNGEILDVPDWGDAPERKPNT
jgi:predicted dehydrogenase